MPRIAQDLVEKSNTSTIIHKRDLPELGNLMTDYSTLVKLSLSRAATARKARNHHFEITESSNLLTITKRIKRISKSN